MNHYYILTRLFIGAVAANLVMLAIIIWAYPEPYSLAMDPFSWLGKMITSGGLPNTRALFLFITTLLVNTCIWKKVLSILPEYRIGRQPIVRIIGRAIPVGFILMAFPCDMFIFFHNVGAGLVVGGLWAFTTSLLNFSKAKLAPITYRYLQVSLHLSALFCGINFLLDTPLKGFSQRPLIIAIIVETGFCLNTLQQARINQYLTCRRASQH